jgi:hypothetical protein
MSTEVARLSSLAALVRSKNAGPFWLTVDLMFRDDEGFQRARACPRLAAPAVAALLGIDESQVLVSMLDSVRAMKISFPRRYSAGSPRDSDTLGGQQYAALLNVMID